MCAHLLTKHNCAFRSVEKILESALAFKIVVDAALMTWRRLGDLVGGDLATASFPREECLSSGCSAKSGYSSALLQRKS